MTRPRPPHRTRAARRAVTAAALGAWVACVAAPAALVVAAGGCGGEYGGAPHAGASAYVPPDRAYRLWYLAPPWVLGAPRTNGVTLTVPLNADELLSGGRTTPVITLALDVMAGTTPAALIAAQVAAARAAGATVRYDARPVVMAGGAMGLEAAFFSGMGVERVAAVTLADGRAALLVFTSGSAIENDPDIGQMLADFEPRSPGM